MIFAAGIAAQTAAALAQAMQNKQATQSQSGSAPQQSFTADLDALMSNAQNSLGGLASGAGALIGNLQSMSQSLLGLGGVQPASPTPSGATQAYAQAATINT